MRNIDYRIIPNDTTNGLAEDIKNFLNNGFELVGGPFFGNNQFHQAVMKSTTEKKPMATPLMSGY